MAQRRGQIRWTARWGRVMHSMACALWPAPQAAAALPLGRSSRDMWTTNATMIKQLTDPRNEGARPCVGPCPGLPRSRPPRPGRSCASMPCALHSLPCSIATPRCLPPLIPPRLHLRPAQNVHPGGPSIRVHCQNHRHASTLAFSFVGSLLVGEEQGQAHEQAAPAFMQRRQGMMQVSEEDRSRSAERRSHATPRLQSTCAPPACGLQSSCAVPAKCR